MFELQHALLWIFITWHYALMCGYLSDDHIAVMGNKNIVSEEDKEDIKRNKTFTYWQRVFNDGIFLYYHDRILHRLGFTAMPWIWHLINLVLHIVNCWLLYLILIPILGAQIAIITMFIWAINPMLNQNVVWISGRPYIISTLMIFICMLFWQNPFVVIPLYALAGITSFVIAFFPVILKIMHPQTWQANFYIAVMVFIGGPFMLWKFAKRFGKKGLVLDREYFTFKRRRLNSIVRLYLYYIWIIICPIRMGWYHQAGFRYNPKWERFNIYTLLGWVTLFWFMGQGIAGWWWILGMLPQVNLFSTNSFIQDRYIYFGSIGLAMIVAPILVKYPYFFVAVATFYCVRSYMWSRYMVNDEKLYRGNWMNHPQSSYAINNLAFFLIQQRRYDEARVVILRGITIDNQNKMLWHNLGVTWAAQGHFKTDEGKSCFLRALDCWKRALQIEPRWKKPAEDIQRMMKLLIENKVITLNKAEAADGMPTIDIPVLMPEEPWQKKISGATVPLMPASEVTGG